MAKAIVIGGGPAGMLAACAAAQNGHSVTLVDHNEKLGKKLFITGKGRCNLTNAADIEDFFKSIPRNAKFLYSALYHFPNTALMELMERYGVPLKTERGGRVFPLSDKSSDVISALRRHLQDCGVKVQLHTHAGGLYLQGGALRGVILEGRPVEADAVILATGGASYPRTGSTGEGYALARSAGHTIIPIRPSLIPVETAESWPRSLMGLSLRNVTLRVRQGKKKVFEELGELLFTHFGVSGPLVLSASACIDQIEGASFSLDLKPGLAPDALDARLLRDFEKNSRKYFENSLDELLPAKLIPVVVELSGIPAQKPVNQISRKERESLCALLKDLRFTGRAFRPIEEAIVTRGGVCVKEINPSTMESRLLPGLYFAGEILDVDGYTGGFNLQIACSTGYLAGSSIQQKNQEDSPCTLPSAQN